jgi:hypothetical protein
MLWLLLAFVVGLIGVFAAKMRRRHRVSSDCLSDIDIGSVSETWLAEQRGSKRD